MDNVDEMMLHQLVQEEEYDATDEEEKLVIMASLIRPRPRINAPP
jgi:hypothetical protein